MISKVAVLFALVAVAAARPDKPASSEEGYQYQQPAQTFSAGEYKAPQQTYEAPRQTYEAPEDSYEAPQRTYEAPEDSYEAPQRTYEAPRQTYKAPEDSYEAPEQTYAAPSAPKASYAAPRSEESEEFEPLMPFNFGYIVEDDETNSAYGHTSNSDTEQVTGQYRVLLPDGRTQIVTYTADRENGYRAEVTYEGEAREWVPPQSAESYEQPKAAYEQPKAAYSAP